ncbi:MAG: DUF4363 family protein [Hydrogenoanaerobacterium sp.]
MKRLVISIIMVAVMISMSVMNTITLYNTRDELTAILKSMAQTVEHDGAAAVSKDAEAFTLLWLKHEKKLMQFIRHSDLEPITWNSARLTHLAKYEDTAELMAEINSVYLQINHLCETQTPSLQTVL